MVIRDKLSYLERMMLLYLPLEKCFPLQCEIAHIARISFKLKLLRDVSHLFNRRYPKPRLRHYKYFKLNYILLKLKVLHQRLMY